MTVLPKKCRACGGGGCAACHETGRYTRVGKPGKPRPCPLCGKAVAFWPVHVMTCPNKTPMPAGEQR